MSAVVLWTAAVAVTVWSTYQLAAAWRGRRRPVRGRDGRWRAPRRYHNGWGEWS